jgi:hypothetical protein
MKKFIIYLFIINALTFAQESVMPVESTENAPRPEIKTALPHTGALHTDANTAIKTPDKNTPQVNIPKTTSNSAAITVNHNSPAPAVKKAAVEAAAKNAAAVYKAPAQKTPVITKATANPAPKDSVNLSVMVQNQMEAAASGEIKTSTNFQESGKSAKEPVKSKIRMKKQEAGAFENIVKTLNDFNKKYLKVFIFILGSGAILGYFFGKRYMSVLFGKSGRNLKNNINQIRNEKPVFIKNKKLYELRSKLAESNNLYDISEESIPEKARNMNVGKGEIMLAAKIKAFQLSKISK